MVCRHRYGNPLGGARPKSASSVNATLPGALQETDYTLKFRLFGQAWGGGIRDAKYFLFRLKNIYAQTQGFTLEPSNPIYQCNRILCHNQAKRPPRPGRSLHRVICQILLFCKIYVNRFHIYCIIGRILYFDVRIVAC